MSEWFIGKYARYLIKNNYYLLSWGLHSTRDTSFNPQMRNWGSEGSHLGCSLQMAELILELMCLIQNLFHHFFSPFVSLLQVKRRLEGGWSRHKREGTWLAGSPRGGKSLANLVSVVDWERNTLLLCLRHCGFVYPNRYRQELRKTQVVFATWGKRT